MAFTTGQAGGQVQQTASVPAAYQGDALELARAQRLAQMLSSQQMPEGQMVSGRFVAPSWTQQLAGLVNAGTGAYFANQAEKQNIELAKKIREGENASFADYMTIKQGRPAIAGTPDIPTETYETVRGTPAQTAIPANPQAAYANLYANPKSSAAQRQFAFGKMNEGPIKVGLEDTLLDPFTMKPVYTGAGKPRAPLQIDTGTAIELRDPNNPTVVLQRIPKSMSPADAARLADEGITVGGGGQPMVRTGVPMGQQQGQPQGQPAFTPSTLPAYQPDPMLTPKQNREQALKFSEKQGSNVTNAKDSFDLMKETSKILASDVASSGRLSSIGTGIGEFFGSDSKASQADAQLTMLSGALTMKQPRFEGPQGVLDVTLYQKLAGDLGNPNIPIQSRLATMNQMVNLQKKYYPAGDWDSIKTKLDDTGKVSLAPSAPTYAINPQTGERIMSTDNGKNWKPAR